MSSATVALRRADESDLAYVERLLSDAGLPSADLRTSPVRFYVGYDGDERIGVGDLERYGTDGLLRSVVVERSARGNGYGTAICDALERRARAEGVESAGLASIDRGRVLRGSGVRGRPAGGRAVRDPGDGPVRRALSRVGRVSAKIALEPPLTEPLDRRFDLESIHAGRHRETFIYESRIGMNDEQVRIVFGF